MPEANTKPSQQYIDETVTKVTKIIDGYLETAQLYRTKYDSATTSVARDIYKKKLITSINRVEMYMAALATFKQENAEDE